ncbi:MAG: hypothetical protein OXG68_07840 [Chloroflexi bacterium]|nr:hypothetical protein [Chloroflexota bacterium]
MRIPMMITADYATVDQSNGKIHVLGIFRNIYADTFPFQHSRMCLALIIEEEISDSDNPHDVTVTLADEDGKEVFSLKGAFEMPESRGGIAPHCNLLLELNDLPFEKPGEYCFYIAINGDELDDSVAIQVVHRGAI